ncbi:MAG: ATP synthase F0 subunit B [Bacilli bacterium]|jgi:F-type H+-transporting ATPase subunit b|nr:ATP synthase F0 subunit B [Bacilli bacterium]MDD3389040.1 ATP synthase F0 subunit B [Bacilli bacterium]MDD4344479.1 ATP synthase F0 subunit B [Bacilli bacterium]MDD4520617.1 ATP synthase F0 subunit B [Bacilli bacterium]MDY0399408.1 ATP synthase F0 subunit B [Bacilli bacterium]
MFNKIVVFSGLPFSKEDFIEKIIPDNIWGLVTQLLALSVIVLIVWLLIYKPVKKILDKRANAVLEDIETTKRDKEELEKKLLASDELVRLEKQKAAQIVVAAEEASARAREAMLLEVKTEMAKERTKALAEIEQAKVDAHEQIQTQIVNVALQASKEVLKREINPTDHARLLEDFVKDVNA